LQSVYLESAYLQCQTAAINSGEPFWDSPEFKVFFFTVAKNLPDLLLQDGVKKKS